MAQKIKRKKIGLIFSYSEGWIAGSYYILNLIHAINTIRNEEKPIIIIFYSKDEEVEKIKSTNYPYLKFQMTRNDYYSPNYNLWQRAVNKVSLKLRKKLVFDKRPKNIVCFPNCHNNYFFEKLPISQKPQWIPDFQEHYLPEFFTKEEVDTRKIYQQKMSQQDIGIVFSSNDAEQDFQKFYPQAKAQTHILNFAVTHPTYKNIELDNLLEKYNLPKKYFFSANQFWKHKNQITLLKAIKILKEKNLDCKVVFSGKMQDYRNPEYVNEIKNYVSLQGLEEAVIFLGFIDRKEQLKLMSESCAVIQPSLFEGWSTVVEDVKAMNQFIILSDLKVHREQIQKNVAFFKPLDESDLAEKMAMIWKQRPNLVYEDYQDNIKNFGQTFLNIINKISKIEKNDTLRRFRQTQ